MNMNMPDTMTDIKSDQDGDVGFQEEMARGVGSAQAGDKATAYRVFQSLASSHGDVPEVWIWLGGTTPDLAEAEAAFQRALSLNSDNEEANLGLRWVALRKQIPGGVTTGMETAGIGRAEFSPTTTDLVGDAFEPVAPVFPRPLDTDIFSVSSATGSTSNTTSAELPNASDTDKSLDMKVDSAGGKRRSIPVGAIILILIAIALYAFAAVIFLMPR
jgi:hypothetical protein